MLKKRNIQGKFPYKILIFGKIRLFTQLKFSCIGPYKILLNTGIPQFTLLMWGHIKNRGKKKPRNSRLLSSNEGEENRIKL